MKKKLISSAAITLLALTTACSEPAPSDEPTTPAVQETQAPEESPEEPSSEEETPEAEPEGEAPAEDSSPSDPDSSDPLEVIVNGAAVSFAPTDVYCKVGGGELRHLIAKTNNRPPLLEVTPHEFAMLKLQQKGAPEKNSSPSGIEYAPEGVMFTDAPIGNATLNGSLECTDIKGN